eukprot:gene32000-41499_t
MLKKYVDKNNPFDNRIDPLNNRQLRSSISVVGYKGMDSSAISRKKSSGRSHSSSDAAESDADAEVSDAYVEDANAEGDVEDADAEGDVEDADAEGDADADAEDSDSDVEDAECEAESEDSDAEGAVSIADSGAEGDAKLGKRTLIAEKANVNSEGEDHLSKRTKETRSLSQTSTKADTIYPESVVAYPVMEVDTNSSLPRAVKSPATFSSCLVANVQQPPSSSQSFISSPHTDLSANSSSSVPNPPQTKPPASSSFSASSPPPTTPAANSSFLSSGTSPDLDNSTIETFHQDYKLLLSVFGGQDSRPFNEQQSNVKESVKFVIKYVVQICTEWKIDLSKEVINESGNSSSQLTLEEKAFWMQVYTDYRI